MLLHPNNLLFVNPHRPASLPSRTTYKNFLINYNDGPGEVVIDIGTIFSKQSKKAPPERRGLVIVEPQGARSVLLDLYRNYVRDENTNDLEGRVGEYYKFMVCWWHRSLQHLPQFHHFVWTFTFLGADEVGHRNKRFGLSGLISSLRMPEFPGYAIRHEILNREHEINIPSIIYNYRGHWQGLMHRYPIPTKSPAFDWTHHLAIENCSEPDYFTEKILDCFLSRTVPIYYGDPRIFRKFDRRGIIVIKSADDALDSVNSLTPDDYLSRLEAIEENYKLAKNYINPDQKLAELVIDEWSKKFL